MSNTKLPIDYTNKDHASILEGLLALAAERLPEWTDQSPNDLGVVLLELLASMGDSLFYNQDRIAGESFLETAVERRSVVQLLRLIGYELRPPLSASADLTLLFDPVAIGPVTILTGATFMTTAATTGAPIDFQFIQRPLSIDRTSLPLGAIDAQGKLRVPPPSPLPRGSQLYKVYRTLPVVQVDSAVPSEVLASSDGSARQRYPLAQAPLVDDTLVVRVDEGAGPEVWTRVPSLFDSASSDKHYAVRRDEAGVVWIDLGDGTYGKIPRRGFNNITASYSVGGGAKGNVNADAITKVTGIDQLKLVRNEKAASGGADAEATADAVRRGPRQFRAMGRAVTASDYEALAKSFGVGKAIAGSPSWNDIRLVVAPTGGGYVSDTLKEDLLAYLDTKRIMTSIIEIADPIYVSVLIEATVTVAPQFSRRLVRQAVMDAVARLLAFENVEFGQTLYISKVYDVIQDIEGVLGVNIRTLARMPPDGSPPDPALPANGQLTFDRLGEIPTWAGFDAPGNDLVMRGGVEGVANE